MFPRAEDLGPLARPTSGRLCASMSHCKEQKMEAQRGQISCPGFHS